MPDILGLTDCLPCRRFTVTGDYSYTDASPSLLLKEYAMPNVNQDPLLTRRPAASRNWLWPVIGVVALLLIAFIVFASNTNDNSPLVTSDATVPGVVAPADTAVNDPILTQPAS